MMIGDGAPWDVPAHLGTAGPDARFGRSAGQLCWYVGQIGGAEACTDGWMDGCIHPSICAPHLERHPCQLQLLKHTHGRTRDAWVIVVECLDGAVEFLPGAPRQLLVAASHPTARGA